MEIETNEINNSIDKSRVINVSKSTLESLVCSICKMIPYKPVTCSKCEVHFCRPCIKQLITKTNRKICPNNCQYVERESSNLLFSLLSKLLIKCRYYEDGCIATLPYDSIFKHERLCENNLFICTFCKKHMSGKAKNGHLEHSCIGDLKYTNGQLKKENELLKSSYKKEIQEKKEYKKKYEDLQLLTSESENNNTIGNSSNRKGDIEETILLPFPPEKIKRQCVEWLESRNIEFSKVEIVFQDAEFMLYSKETLNPGDQILFIPRAQTYSFRSIHDSNHSTH